jgi:ribosomal protein L37AE/L43A
MSVVVLLFLVLLVVGTIFRPKEEEPTDVTQAMNNYKACPSCGGSGMKTKRKDIINCPTCNGEGIVNK